MAARAGGKKKVDRRTAIADAAIELLAETGTRGLTHRMVDRRLGIPEGSTGAYYRTRQALLEAAAERVRELDFVEIDETRAAAAANGSDAVDTITQLVLDCNLPENRSRTLARNVLFMEAANNEQLAQVMHSSGRRYFTEGEEILEGGGVTEPDLPARSMAAFMAGLIIGQVIYPEPTLSPDEVRAEVKRFLGSH